MFTPSTPAENRLSRAREIWSISSVVMLTATELTRQALWSELIVTVEVTGSMSTSRSAQISPTSFHMSSAVSSGPGPTVTPSTQNCRFARSSPSVSSEIVPRISIGSLSAAAGPTAGTTSAAAVSAVKAVRRRTAAPRDG